MHVLVHLQSYTAKKGCLLTSPPLGDSPGVSRCTQIYKQCKKNDYNIARVLALYSPIEPL